MEYAHGALAMSVADLFVEVDPLSLPEAASRLAAAGVPVFPCVPFGKRPASPHGFHDATTDARRVETWWRRRPTANIGMPTGSASGLDVLDIDRRGHESGFAAFARAQRAGLADGWIALVRTPSGGLHAFYPAVRHRPQRSWQAASARMDFRGEGGYVIVPPSVVVTASGRYARYVLTDDRRPAPSPIDANVLRRFVAPVVDRLLEPALAMGTESDVDRLSAWVERLSEGERNRGLFWASCRLVEAGLTEAQVRAVLAPAAGRAGLPDHEISSTVRSAFRTTGRVRRGDIASSEPAATRVREPAGRRVLA